MQVVKIIYKYRLLFIAGLILASILLFFLSRTTPPSVQSTSLTNDQVNVLLDTPINVTFTTPTTSSERRRLTYNFIPPIADSPTWDSSNTIVRLNSHSTLTKNTHYTLDILYNDKSIYTLSFTTNPYDNVDLREQASKQTQDDLLFATKEKELIIKYPWYPKLPIITPNYYIFYSFIDKEFKIHLTSETDQRQLELDGVGAIKKLGIPAQDIKYSTVVD